MNLRKLLKMIYRVYINFKKGILDPEAEAIKRTIDSMGYKTIKNISKGKFFDIEISSSKNTLGDLEKISFLDLNFKINSNLTKSEKSELNQN